MKKVIMLAAVVAALVSCQSKGMKAEEAAADSTALAMEEPTVDEGWVFVGTVPATKTTPAANYMLTLNAEANAVDTVYTMDVTWLGADNGNNKVVSSKGKKQEVHKVVKNQPKKAIKLTPADGSAPMYLVVVNDTTLRMVNDSTLQETATSYDLLLQQK